MADRNAPPLVGAAVRAARLLAGFSQEELAEIAGISARSVSDIERGISRAPRAQTLADLADALGVDPQSLTAPAMSMATPDRAEDGSRQSFGELLRAHRRAAGYTQRQLARAALLSERAVSDLERGVNQFARHTTAVLLADGLRLDGFRRTRFLAAAGGIDDIPAPATVRGTPSAAFPMFGRNRDLDALIDAIGRSRLVTVVGPGGVGKTRLLIAAAERLGEERCLAFVSAAPANGPGTLLAAVADALGIREAGSVALEALVLERLGGVDLLVLDNVEQVVEAAADLVTRILATTSVAIVVSSRVRLRVAGEHVATLEPLRSSPDPVTGADPPAVNFFIAVAGVERPDWSPTELDRTTIAAICSRVDGLPLAIELAAAWMRMLPPEEILLRLDRPLEMLRGGRRDMPERHRALRTTVAGSVELLSDGARRLFGELCVLDAPFSIELAAAITEGDGAEADVAIDLAELTDGSLLQVSADSGEARFAWLATVREFARAELVDLGGVEAAMDRFTGAIVTLAETAAPHLVGPGQQAWLARLDRERDHLRVAVEWTVRVGQTDLAARLGAALWRYWYIAGHYTEGVTLLIRVLQLQIVDDLVPTATARYGFATLRYLQGEVDEAQAEYRHALASYRRSGDAHGVSSTLSNLGMIEQYRGEFAPAHELFSEALAAASEGGAVRAEAVALSNLAALAADQGDLVAAGRRYDEAIAVFRNLGDVRAVADLVGNLAVLSITTGELDRAEELAADARATFEIQGDPSGTADALRLLGRVAVERFDGEAARDRFRRALAISESLGDRWGVACCQSALAMLEDDLMVAEAAVQSAIATQRELQHYQGLIEALIVGAEIARRRGDLPRARARVAEAAAGLAEDDRPGRHRLVVTAAALGGPPATHLRLRAGAEAALALEATAGRSLDALTRTLADLLELNPPDALNGNGFTLAAIVADAFAIVIGATDT